MRTASSRVVMYLQPPSSMVPLPRAVALGKLKALAAGAKLVRSELGRSKP